MPTRRVDPSHFSPDTRTFIELLSRHNVRYLIVGGEAVILHGHARLTGDVDFFYGRARPNAERLFAAVQEFWGGQTPGLKTSEELEHPGLVLQYGIPPNRIDLINDIDGLGFDEAWPGRVEAVLLSDHGEIAVPYLGLDDLIKNKAASGRPKDLDDLSYLRRARTQAQPEGSAGRHGSELD